MRDRKNHPPKETTALSHEPIVQLSGGTQNGSSGRNLPKRNNIQTRLGFVVTNSRMCSSG
ncbi:MAG: hypothetical protein ACFFHV_16870 [Promethearchaeota archaeon]